MLSKKHYEAFNQVVKEVASKDVELGKQVYKILVGLCVKNSNFNRRKFDEALSLEATVIATVALPDYFDKQQQKQQQQVK